MKNNNGLNPDGYNKEDFLRLKFFDCPYCQSKNILQTYEEKEGKAILTCLTCNYHQEWRFVKVCFEDGSD